MKNGTEGISGSLHFCWFVLCKLNCVTGKMFRAVFPAIIFLLFSAKTLHALTPVVIDENTESLPLGLYMEILEDATGELTIDDVTKPEMKERWFQSRWEEPNFGKSRSAFWFRFDINNRSKKDDYVLKSYWPLYDQINLYYVHNQEIISGKKYGNIFPFNNREKSDIHFIFSIPEQRSSLSVYIRVKTETSVQMPLKLMSENMSDLDSKYYLMFYSVFFGILFVMFFYNLVIFLAIKDTTYLFYIIYLCAQMFFHLFYLNIGYQFLWSESPNLNLHGMPVLMGLGGIAGLMFAKHFLNIKSQFLKLNFYYNIIILVLIALTINSIFSVFVPLKLLNIAGFVWVLTLIISSLYCYFEGYKAARFFLYSWIIMLIGTLILILKNLGIISPNFFTSNSQILGISVEVIMISFALGNRINIMKHEKEEAQEEALRIQKEATETLEVKVTERTSELAAANEKLRDLDRAKTDFFANISHELRTPLTIMLAPVEEALNGKSMSSDDLEMMKRSGLNLLSLINDLLDVSRMTAGRMKLNVSETDLDVLVEQFCTGIEPAARLKGISVSFNAFVKPVRAYVDSERINHVISNFFSNSFKFTGPGGRIDISVGSDDNHANIVFSDTGCGIPADKISTIFDRFTQGDTGTTRRYEGTGIGLSIVKELVELHRGEVEIESRDICSYPENHGTTVTVRLPLGMDHLKGRSEIFFTECDSKIIPPLPHVRGVDTSLSPEVHDSVEFPEDAQSILVVEDNSDLRRLLVNMLKGRYIVREASNGSEAVAILEISEEIDLVLSDIMMPGMDGYELLKWIRCHEKLEGLPVLFLTARAEGFMKVEGLDLGATDYVTKPFNSDELLLRIRNQIELQKLRNSAIRNYNRLLAKMKSVNSRQLSDEGAARIKAVCEFIRENCAQEIRRDDLADAAGMNPDTFSRLFNLHTGKTLGDYINGIRIDEAKQRLAETYDTVTRISIDTGFDSIRTFNRVFKKITGVTPLEYRGVDYTERIRN